LFEDVHVDACGVWLSGRRRYGEEESVDRKEQEWMLGSCALFVDERLVWWISDWALAKK